MARSQRVKNPKSLNCAGSEGFSAFSPVADVQWFLSTDSQG